MGRKSTKENKNIYQIYREEENLTREKASELMEYVSDDRLEKIESDKSLPHPDEILLMAKAYKAPDLVNYYCSHECPIGQVHVPEVKMKDLSQVVLEMLASLNALEKKKDRLIEITSDGVIHDDEYEDFGEICRQLTKISNAATALKMWIEKSIADGDVDPEKL